MKKVELLKIAYGRSGDKGNHANIGLIAREERYYSILKREVTAEKVKEFFKEYCEGEVERFELPNINALNFLLKDSLAGGGTLSLRTDSQGKTFAAMLLRMEIDASA